jgi:hypothetical protein
VSHVGVGQWRGIRVLFAVEIPAEEAAGDEIEAFSAGGGGPIEVRSMHSWEHTNTSLDDLGGPSNANANAHACVALYDYKAAADDELSIRAGEALATAGDEVDGWIKVANAAGQEGLVPASYLGAAAPPQPAVAVATALYGNDEPGMLPFDEGEMIEILEMDSGDGYFLGRCRGQVWARRTRPSYTLLVQGGVYDMPRNAGRPFFERAGSAAAIAHGLGRRNQPIIQ